MIKNTNSLVAVQGLVNQLAPIFGYSLGFDFAQFQQVPENNLSVKYHKLSFLQKKIQGGNISLSDKEFGDIVKGIAGYEKFILTTTGGAVTSTTIAITGAISNSKNANDILEIGFVYGTSANPTTANTKIVKALGSLSHVITGLTASTTYHVRMYAINGYGVHYSNDVVLATTA